MAERNVGERTELEDDGSFEGKGEGKSEDKGKILPDLIKKAVLTGMGALFLTEESIRGAAGQLKLPKEALAYLLSQADRTRAEVVRVVSVEMRRFLESETLQREMWKLLTGVTIEVNATVQLKPSTDQKSGVKINFKKKKEGEPESGPESDEPAK